MNNYQQFRRKSFLLAFVLLAMGAYGQTQRKEYKETFKVEDNSVLAINTSHADIEFDTWNRNEVVIEASIELEGASEEEAAAYFEENGIKILGNSERIEISTSGSRAWQFRTLNGHLADLENIVIDIPEIPDLEPFFMELEIPELPEIAEMPPMPPMPPMKFKDFDYEKYKEEGEKYIEKWAMEFSKNFDEKYEKKWEEWGETFAKRMEEKAAQMEERTAEREERMKEREEIMKEREEVRRKAQEERRKVMEEKRKLMEEQSEARKNVIISGDAPTIFFRSSEGENKSFKVKKSIKIKMPKSTKLDMNVRHGEVKLADNTKNMQATLSYSRLLASTIDGDETNILASYSPVEVDRWNYGKLKTQFSEGVALRDVQHLNLVSTSSEVTIDRLLETGMLKNNLGVLKINAVNQNFKELDISVENGELVCVLPQGPFKFRLEGVATDMSVAESLALDKQSEGKKVIYTGGNSGNAIKVDSRYSDVVLRQ
ncbi:hypothetical protein [Lentiprolixibacter aurantiacus]|uniref:Adhesin domain-containing protein n=1 Tax=Lentiprolixibacter aurantiacus TaxID=2993939 RepID=A0AAE3MP57_9FLAO|nr:hypothetical protein [Lentiprolixibacter aurantiacus]MCX2720444.1 hypothetical protein [Lentiprolixibacter aurantiacus]